MEKEVNEDALKHLFGKALLKRIGVSVAKIHPPFDRKQFNDLFVALEPLEMKPRVHLIRDALHQALPENFSKAVKILRRSAADGTLSGFDLWPYTEFVQSYGLNESALSLDALSEFTQIFTAEWAVRPFIKRNQKFTLSYLLKCAHSDNEHLRRWASEGTRPRLPWGERLQDFVKDPSPAFPILEALKFDESLYVRKSVSNHLNDISKDHPGRVIKILNRWQKEAGVKHTDKIDWMIKRSLRTLIKQGDPAALGLIGVKSDVQVKFKDFKVHEKKIKMGERLNFSFVLVSKSAKSQKLVVDYVVHFIKANGAHAQKVFKLKNLELGPKASVEIKKSHSFKKITTREYYPGLHAVEIQVNGKIVGKCSWHLSR